MVKGVMKRTARRPRAVTSDILPPAPTREPPAKWRPYYNHLTKLKERLASRMSHQVEQASEEAPNFGLHMAEAGSDENDRNLTLGLITSEQEAMYEIDAAINRILTGAFGVCEATGKPIETDRLKAIPWARFSSEAEKGFEKKGKFRRTRLGDRERVLKVSPKELEPNETEE